jgi:transposase
MFRLEVAAEILTVRQVDILLPCDLRGSIPRSKTMARRQRRNHSPAFKAKAALDAVRGDNAVAELCEKYDLHANQVADWKNQLLSPAADVFGAPSHPAEPPVDMKALHANIGQQALEIDFLESALSKTGTLSAKR